jgi:uncharacterized protein YndB with AHSA1/START domain
MSDYHSQTRRKTLWKAGAWMSGKEVNTDQKGVMITVETTVERSVEWVWKCFTDPAHIVKWNFASEDWQCPTAENTLTPGGKFCYRMEAKDGTAGFDFEGTFDEVEENRHLAFRIGDRAVTVDFLDMGNATKVTETFEAENVFSLEIQRGGWQAILDQFKKHAEQ